jgi:hypothetical protein
METAKFDGETWHEATEVFPGFWSVPTRHRPGGSQQMPEINNRCLVFRVTEPVGAALVAVNQTSAAAIPAVKRIEEQTGLRVRHLLSPGGGHHLQVAPWHEAFPEATVWFEPVRIHRTANGAKLLALPRVKNMPLVDPFPAWKGELEVLVFDGLYGLSDEQSPHEGGADTMFSSLKLMFRFMVGVSDPTSEVWLHHVPSGTVIGGENLGWMMPAAELARRPMMERSMYQAGAWINTMARPVADKAKIAAHWKTVLGWPAKTLITFHDWPGYALTDGKATLETAVRGTKQA